MTKRKGLLVALAGLWLLIPGAIIISLLVLTMAPQIGGRIYALFPSRKKVREALRRESIAGGLNPDWLDAISMHEGPYWKLNAINLTAGDAARGGAYGPTQITTKTARAYGYSGDMEAFRKDANLAAKWSVIILKAGNPKSFADAAAWWNAGKRRFSDLAPNHVTRTKYWPAVEKTLAYVQSNPPEIAA